MVSVAARRLEELEPGSRVALHLPKDERYVALVLALIRAATETIRSSSS
jgi:acyl-CoA synthetase (AMP-forming)/AMP-acid ligase II